VWEQAPSPQQESWGAAIVDCIRRNVGGTVGWRLPSVVELRSVLDPSLPAPFVPASAFTISTSDTTPAVRTAFYWSATTFSNGPTNAWSVFLSGGVGGGGVAGNDKLDAVSDFRAWCVRGPMNADAY
jgi:hypothetical protein